MIPAILRSFEKPLLTVLLDSEVIATVFRFELPCEERVEVALERTGRILTFVDANGKRYGHSLSTESGWCALSVRVHKNFACQADCLVGNELPLTPERFNKGELQGIRFQPIYLPGCASDPAALIGQGMFYRGLHYPGLITRGNISLSCICDHCGVSFRLQSFHAGFSNCDYMYSSSGLYTLVYREAPATPITAPDGSTFARLNPLRCPHCQAPYIDFERYPSLRNTEYYGHTLFGMGAVTYE